MALMMQIPQFAPLNIPAPTPRARPAPAASGQGGGLFGQILNMGGKTAMPGTAGVGGAGAGGAAALSPETMAQIIASLGMML